MVKFVEEERQKALGNVNSKTTTATDYIKAQEDKDKEIAKNIKILGDSSESTYGSHTITCTVKNENSVSCKVKVQAIYYDSKNNVINTKEVMAFDNIPSNGIKGFTIRNFDNVSKINRYELKPFVQQYYSY